MRYVLLAIFLTALFVSVQAKAECFPQVLIDKILIEEKAFPALIMDAGHYWLILYTGGGLYYLVAISPEISCIVSQGRIFWYRRYDI